MKLLPESNDRNASSLNKLQKDASHLLADAVNFERECQAFAIKTVNDHPFVSSACIMSTICFSTPAMREAVADVSAAGRARATALVDEMVMANRNKVSFPATILGRPEEVMLSEPRASVLAQSYLKARESVGQVLTTGDDGADGGWGSAFSVSEDGKFIASNHVVSERTNFRIVDRFGKAHPAKLIATAPEDDLAVLRLTKKSSRPCFKPIKFGPDLQIGYHKDPDVQAFSFGYPSPKLTAAIKADIKVNWKGTKLASEDGLCTMALNAPKGNSGGPILNSDGKAIGVVCGGPEPGNHRYHALTTVVPIGRAKALLESI
ncbi:MAG TPA: serine protease [Oculatellaceae cyanobacterium]